MTKKHSAVTEGTAIFMCVHLNTQRYKSALPMLQVEACVQNNKCYEKLNSHVRFPAEPSTIRMCEVSGFMAELMRPNMVICHACNAVPHLTQPSQNQYMELWTQVRSPAAQHTYPKSIHAFFQNMSKVLHEHIHKPSCTSITCLKMALQRIKDMPCMVI